MAICGSAAIDTSLLINVDNKSSSKGVSAASGTSATGTGYVTTPSEKTTNETGAAMIISPDPVALSAGNSTSLANEEQKDKSSKKRKPE